MKIIPMVITGLFLSYAPLNGTVSAQAQAKSPTKSLCLSDPAFKQFDFWLGSWNVTAKGSDKLAGTNVIKKIEGGCAISEEWKGASGTSGSSINHYNPITGKWQQRWVAAGAYSIDMIGEFDGTSLMLEGTIYYYSNKTSFPFRGTWTPNKDGSVQQFFEQYAPKKQEWVSWFDSRYVKQ